MVRWRCPKAHVKKCSEASPQQASRVLVEKGWLSGPPRLQDSRPSGLSRAHHRSKAVLSQRLVVFLTSLPEYGSFHVLPLISVEGFDFLTEKVDVGSAMRPKEPLDICLRVWRGNMRLSRIKHSDGRLYLQKTLKAFLWITGASAAVQSRSASCFHMPILHFSRA